MTNTPLTDEDLETIEQILSGGARLIGASWVRVLLDDVKTLRCYVIQQASSIVLLQDEVAGLKATVKRLGDAGIEANNVYLDVSKKRFDYKRALELACLELDQTSMDYIIRHSPSPGLNLADWFLLKAKEEKK